MISITDNKEIKKCPAPQQTAGAIKIPAGNAAEQGGLNPALQRFPAGGSALFYVYDFSGAFLGLHRNGRIRIAQGGNAVDHMVCGNADLV